VLGAGERVRDLAVSGEHWQREQHDEHPRDEYGGGRVALGAHVYRGDRVDDGQEPVQRHEHQGVDTCVRGNHDQVLDHFAPDVAEWPVRQHVVDGSERYTEHYEQQVGQREVDDQQVGGAPHLLVRHHHDHHQQVAQQPDHHDDAEQYGHGQRNDALHLRRVNGKQTIMYIF